MDALSLLILFIHVPCLLLGVGLTTTDATGLETVLCNGLRCGFGTTCEEPLCFCKTELSVLARLDTTPPLLYCKGVCSVTNRTCPTSNTTCNIALGANTCDCSLGYTRSTSGHCLLIDDQCSSEPCGQNSVCTNTPGSFTCTCLTGFTPTTTSTLTDGCSATTTAKIKAPVLTTARTTSHSPSTPQRGGSVGPTVSQSGIHSSGKTENTGTTLTLTADGTSPSSQTEVVSDTGAIVGAVLGATIGLLLLGMVIYCVVRYCRSKKKTENRPVVALANQNTNLAIGREVGIYEIVSGPENTVYETADTNNRNDARTYESLSSPSNNVSTKIMSPGDAHYGDLGYYNLDNMSPVYVNRDVSNARENGPVYTNM